MSRHNLKTRRLPADLLQAFRDAVDEFREWQDGTPEPAVEYRGKRLLISQACGLAWNASEILPGDCAREIGDFMEQFGWECGKCLTSGASYAQGARALRQMIGFVHEREALAA